MTEENDITLEPENDADMAKDPAEAIKKLKEEIKTLRSERDEYLAGWQRAKADFINARKDEEKARAAFVKFANEGLLAEMIPIMESFERATGNKEVWEKADKNWRSGIEHIFSLFKKTLADSGLKEISPAIDTVFDATRDEVVSHEKVEKAEQNNKIISVVEKGYEINGKIIKPAKVKVGEYKI